MYKRLIAENNMQEINNCERRIKKNSFVNGGDVQAMDEIRRRNTKYRLRKWKNTYKKKLR